MAGEHRQDALSKRLESELPCDEWKSVRVRVSVTEAPKIVGDALRSSRLVSGDHRDLLPGSEDIGMMLSIKLSEMLSEFSRGVGAAFQSEVILAYCLQSTYVGGHDSSETLDQNAWIDLLLAS